MSRSISGRGGDSMKRVRLEFISSGFRDLLMSDEVSEVVMDAAGDVAKTASAMSTANRKRGHGDAEYVVKGPRKGGYGGGRIIAYVATNNLLAYYDNVRNATLEKAVWSEAE